MENRIIIDTKTGSSAQFTTEDYGKISFTQVKGKSIQVVTVQGKNILPSAFNEWESGQYDVTTGSKVDNTSRARCKRLIQVSASTNYYVSFGTGFLFAIRAYNSSGVFLSSIGTVYQGKVFTTPINTAYISVTFAEDPDTKTLTFASYQSAFSNGTIKPFICLDSTVDKSYAAFVPNSPSPDYPAPITILGDIGSFIIGAKNTDNSKSNQITVSSSGYSLPDGTCDILDLVNKKKAINCAKVVLNGSESVGVSTENTNTVSFTIPASVATGLSGSVNLYCSHFAVQSGSADVEHIRFNGSAQPIIQIWINKTRLTGWLDTMTTTQKNNLVKTWLTANNVTIVYQLAIPVTTDITVTPNNYLTSYKGITNVFTLDTTQPEFTATLSILAYDVDRYIKLVTSEHANKPKFQEMLKSVLKKVDVSFLNIDSEFDIDNAVGAQLDIIGVMLGLSRNLNFQPSGGASSILSDNDYRQLIEAKIILSQWDGTLGTLADALSNWNPSVYFTIKDNQDMTVDVVAIGANQLQKELIMNGYVVPKPAGVKINYAMSTDAIFAYDSDTNTLAGYDKGKWL